MNAYRNRPEALPRQTDGEGRHPSENYRANQRRDRPRDAARETAYGVGVDAAYTAPRRQAGRTPDPASHGEPHWEHEQDFQAHHPGYHKHVAGQGSEGGFWTQDVDDSPDDRLTGEELRRYLPEDHDYMAWREDQMRAHDQDYAAWRDARHRAYDDDYARWRRERRGAFVREFEDWRSRRRDGD
ncbi:MAG: hypothetical protein GC201_04675 [Alphaproteobacteria bacterium]|nr:hypothetical protein [Alphaproteobacteria bacterium]